jgi:hypothetical protein
VSVVSQTEIRGTGKRHILYGWILEMDDGKKVYLARRRWNQVFRSGKASISGAIADETASWAIDEDLLIKLRTKGVEFVGVKVIDKGEIYLTRLKTFFTPKTSKLRDYTGVGKGGSRQRYVPFKHFTLKKSLVCLGSA